MYTRLRQSRWKPVRVVIMILLFSFLFFFVVFSSHFLSIERSNKETTILSHFAFEFLSFFLSLSLSLIGIFIRWIPSALGSINPLLIAMKISFIWRKWCLSNGSIFSVELWQRSVAYSVCPETCLPSSFASKHSTGAQSTSSAKSSTFIWQKSLFWVSLFLRVKCLFLFCHH